MFIVFSVKCHEDTLESLVSRCSDYISEELSLNIFIVGITSPSAQGLDGGSWNRWYN